MTKITYVYMGISFSQSNYVVTIYLYTEFPVRLEIYRILFLFLVLFRITANLIRFIKSVEMDQP